MQALFDNLIVGTALIFLIRVFSITLSTWRYLIMGRANKALVSSVAFVEALTFALTFGVVANDLGNAWYLIAYCLGFAVGTLVGTMIEERLARGYESITVISMAKSLQIVEAVRAAGYGATRTSGEGSSGAVGMVYVVARRRDVPAIASLVNDLDPKAFVTIGEARSVMRGTLGYGRS